MLLPAPVPASASSREMVYRLAVATASERMFSGAQKVENRVLNMWRAMQSHPANFQELHCSYLQWPLRSVLDHCFNHKDSEGSLLLWTQHITWTCLSRLACALPPADWQVRTSWDFNIRKATGTQGGRGVQTQSRLWAFGSSYPRRCF